MPKFYFTFGSSHSHLVAGTRFNMNRIAEIEADTMNEARDKAFKVFKDKWSFGYDNLVSAGVRQFNLDVVPLTDAMIHDELTSREPTHLGDAIYAQYDGCLIKLHTSRVVPSKANEPQSETIYLNKSVLEKLFEYAKEKQILTSYSDLDGFVYEGED